MKGRRRTPNVINIARGNPGKRRLNDDEPEFPALMPERPLLVNKYAEEEWDSISLYLYNSGLLSVVDRAMLKLYCDAWGRVIEEQKKFQSQNCVTVIELANGQVTTNPTWRILQKEQQNLHRFLREFGMSPSARAMIRATEDGADAAPNQFAEFMKRKKRRNPNAAS